VSPQTLHLIIPGPLEQRTGGYIYDGHMAAGLRGLGWSVQVHNLEGAFPQGDAEATAALGASLASIPDAATVVIDGLAMGGLPVPVREHAARLRIIALVHHPLSEETGLSEDERRRFRASEQAALAHCRGVIVTSPFTRAVLGEYGVPEERIRTVLPGTEPGLPAEGPGPGAPPALLCVASVTPRKGYDVLVDALARIREVDWTCTCVGSLDRAPEHAKDVLDRVAEAALEDRVTFVGEHPGEALDAFYRRASAFVLPSYYEGYGMALTEALARGLPVVSTTGGAIPRTVPADASLLVQPGDPEAFAGALRSLLTDPPLLRRLSEAARVHASSLPDWDAAARAFADAVASLTA